LRVAPIGTFWVTFDAVLAESQNTPPPALASLT
jgi:hypothetical protein